MEIRHKVSWLTGLVIGCPVGKRMNSCPFKELAKLPLSKSLENISEMKTDEVEKTIRHHQDCLQKRE